MEKNRWDIEYPKQLRVAEGDLLELRTKNRSGPRTGVAISGGGIRSATFALGVFQAFAKKGHLGRFDYLSTVSGGGYFGGFYGSLFTRPQAKFEDVEKALADDSPQLSYLRRNGRFLAPAGGRDLLLGGAVLFRNWVAVILVIGCLAVGLGLLLEFFSLLLHPWLRFPENSPIFGLNWQEMLWWDSGYRVWLSEWLWVSAALVALAAAPLGWSYFLVGSSESASTAWIKNRPSIKPLMIAVNAALVGIALSQYPRYPLLSCALCYLSTVTMAQTIAADHCLALQGKRIEDVQLKVGEGFIALILGFTMSILALASALSFGSSQPVQGGLAFLVVLLLCRSVLHFASPKDAREVDRDQFSRHMVSVWLKRWLVVAGFCLALGLIQTGGRTLYLFMKQDVNWLLGAFGTVMTALSGYARRGLVSLGSSATKEERSRSWMSSLPAILGALLALLLAILVSALVAQLIYSEPPFHELNGEPIATRKNAIASATRLVLIFLVLSFCFGLSRRLLNNSTHLPLYSARITRAYLGATNKLRVPLHKEKPSPAENAKVAAHRASALHLMPNDDIPLKSYYRTDNEDSPYAKGAPLHLINVTINETVDGRLGDYNPDAKGLGLAIGPCGMSAGVKHHRLFSWNSPDKVTVFPERADYRVFEPITEPQFFKTLSLPFFKPQPEQLSLGRWLGVSGAAFSTGLGLRTSFGTSFLAGITNIRLGHWWFAGVKRAFTLTRFFGPVFWVQQYLFRELAARFPGTANSLWYLSDGGHFENMGAYELLRRRLQTIVILDGEADPHYEFDGLAHLVRKARIDFGAEIHFLGREHPEFQNLIAPELQAQFGTLDEMRRGKWERDVRLVSEASEVAELRVRGFKLQAPSQKERSQVHAAVARVVYSDKSEGVLIYVKPTLTGRESPDVTRYHTEHPSFPHESTGDQFFDEAQWESYRKLGADIGQRVFETWPVRDAPPA